MSEPRWLQVELAHQLAPVEAPDALWSRIETQMNEPRVRPTANSFAWGWAVAAALAMAIAAGTSWKLATGRGLESTAMEALHSAEPVDFPSEDPAEIRAWVKAKSGIQIELPDHIMPGSGVRLLGARMVTTQGRQAAVVAYRVKGESAALLVCPTKGGEGGAHRFTRSGPEGVVSWTMRSWTMRSQTYTIASSAARDQQAACLLCHSGWSKL